MSQQPEPLYTVTIGTEGLAHYIKAAYTPARIVELCADLLGIPADELRAIINRREAGQE